MKNIYHYMVNEKIDLDKIKIKKSYDYHKFRLMADNRQINTQHLARLKESMKEDYLFTVIIVNEHFQVCDGQHRFMACRDLKLPIYYVVCRGYGIKEVTTYNEQTSNWSVKNYLDRYVTNEYPEYINYKIFQKKYGFPHRANITLLCGEDYRTHELLFKKGTFKINNLQRAIDYAEQITKTKKLYKDYKRNNFIGALYKLMQKDVFSMDEFLKKFEIKSSMMKNCTTVKEYIDIIEEIYNFKRTQKVNLRF